jgi:uncharacterized protein (DUF2147 family)
MRVLASIAMLAASAPLSAAEIEGRWRSPGGNSIIDVAPCGDAWCGTVAWASERAKQDARKSTEQLVGTQLLTELREAKPGRWEGRIFIPDRNMRATAKLQLVGPGELKVSGCAARILCSSQVWSRYDQPLPE